MVAIHDGCDPFDRMLRGQGDSIDLRLRRAQYRIGSALSPIRVSKVDALVLGDQTRRPDAKCLGARIGAPRHPAMVGDFEG